MQGKPFRVRYLSSRTGWDTSLKVRRNTLRQNNMEAHGPICIADSSLRRGASPLPC